MSRDLNSKNNDTEHYWILGGSETEHHLSRQLNPYSRASERWKQITEANEFQASTLPIILGKALGDHMELVLGIRPGGSSYVLLSDRDLNLVHKANALPDIKNFRHSRPIPASEFASLAPIWLSPEQLSRKLRDYEQKATSQHAKAKRKESHYPISKANPISYFGVDNMKRAKVEQHRILYHLLLDNIIPERYNLPSKDFSAGVRLFSFQANSFGADANNVVLDVTWQRINHNASTHEMSEDQPCHFVIEENKILSRGAQGHFSGTQHDSMVNVSAQVEPLFQISDEEPICLVLCWRYIRELEPVLTQGFGLDTLTFATDIAPILMPALSSQEVDHPVPTKLPTRNPRDPRIRPTESTTRRNSRSRSPPIKRESSPVVLRPRSPNRRRRLDKGIYIIDVKSLFEGITARSGGSFDTIPGVGKLLGLSMEEGWCAGNEAQMIFEIWRSLMSNEAIDEKRATIERMESAMMKQRQDSGGLPLSPPVEARPTLTFAQQLSQPRPTATSLPVKTNPYDLSEDEDSDEC